MKKIIPWMMGLWILLVACQPTTTDLRFAHLFQQGVEISANESKVAALYSNLHPDKGLRCILTRTIDGQTIRQEQYANGKQRLRIQTLRDKKKGEYCDGNNTVFIDYTKKTYVVLEGDHATNGWEMQRQDLQANTFLSGNVHWQGKTYQAEALLHGNEPTLYLFEKNRLVYLIDYRQEQPQIIHFLALDDRLPKDIFTSWKTFTKKNLKDLKEL